MTLTAIVAVAAFAYVWALNSDPLETYYAAAVRSMSTSWHDFIFGAFDPSGTVSLDKLPGAFWLQVLCVRIFGFHTWTIVLPQTIEGVASVIVLYLAVTRLAGVLAGLIAASALAVSPATTALDRGNISDTLMVLLLVLGADALTRAITTGRSGQLVLAAAWVGLAFQAKMIEVWMVLPTFALAYVIDGPGSGKQRARQLMVAGAVAAIVSLSWMTAVMLVPDHSRPYVDGSQNDSTYSQVFVYNGFGRFSDESPLQLLAGQSFARSSLLSSPPAEPDRLLRGNLGRDTGWLLPSALILAGTGLFLTRRRPRGDPLRAAFVLWGGWLLTLVVVFSAITAINPYYTGALAPAIAALFGSAVAACWGPIRRSARGRIASTIFFAATTGYAGWLVASAGRGAPGWVLPLVITVSALSVIGSAVSIVDRHDKVVTAAFVAGLAASALSPTLAAGFLVARHEGAFDTPFESAQDQTAVATLFLTIPAQVALTLPKLEQAQLGAPDLLATETSALAAVFIYDFGKEALPIGGFTGTIPSPTLAELKSDVRLGTFHLVITGTSSDPRIEWIATHCQAVASANRLLHNYFCGRFG